MAIARGQITLVDINEVVVGSTPPSVKVANETIWLDTSVDPPMLKVWDGSKWKEANDYEIGGVNILPNSNFETSDNPSSGFQWSVTKGSTSVVEVVDVSTQNIGFKNALHCKNTSNLTSGIYYNIWPRNDQNLIGKTFMLSGMVKYTGVTQGSSSTSKLQLGKLIMTYTNTSGGTVTSTIRPNPIVGTSEWVKFEIPIKLSSSYKYARGSIYFSLDSCVGEFWLTGVKLEEGQKATAWTPSYVDSFINTESKITNAKAEIKIETDKISQNVSNLTTRVSTTEDTVSGFTTEIKEISDKQANLDTAIDGIKANVSTIESSMSSNLIENGDFKTNVLGWSKVNASILRSTYSGKTWAEMYATTVASDRYLYTETKAVNGKNHIFSLKLAQYSSSYKFYRIRLQYFNETASEWVTQQEFTGETEATRAKPHNINYEFTALSNKYRVWVGKLDTEKFDIYVTDFVLQCNHDIAKKSDLEILDDKISTTIGSYDERLGNTESKLEQTSDKLEMTFSSSVVGNLITNGKPNRHSMTKGWEYTCKAVGTDDYIYIDTYSSTVPSELRTTRFAVTPSTSYTIGYKYKCQASVLGITAYVRFYNSLTGLFISSVTLGTYKNGNNTWQTVKKTFEVPSGISYCELSFVVSTKSTSTTNKDFYVTECMCLEGYSLPDKFVSGNTELIKGKTIITEDGVKIIKGGIQIENNVEQVVFEGDDEGNLAIRNGAMKLYSADGSLVMSCAKDGTRFLEVNGLRVNGLNNCLQFKGAGQKGLIIHSTDASGSKAYIDFNSGELNGLNYHQRIFYDYNSPLLKFSKGVRFWNDDADKHIEADGMRRFRPASTNASWKLGDENFRWSSIYSVTALNLPSDRNMKIDIQYLDDTALARTYNNNITSDDCYEFISSLPFATFKYKDVEDYNDNKTTLGFIAQDVQGTKVGDFLIQEKMIETVDENDNPEFTGKKSLSFNTNTYIGIIGVALQKACEKIEVLEEENISLKAQLDEIKSLLTKNGIV